MSVKCTACGGHGGQMVTVFHSRNDPNDCSPDWDDCGACEGTGELPDAMTAAHVSAVLEDGAREEAKLEEAEAAFYAFEQMGERYAGGRS